MNRRSFIQSMAAAFGAVTLGVRLGGVIEQQRIRYELFTDMASARYDLSSPWSHEGAVYCSDARKLIAHPGEFSGAADAKLPDVSKLWWDEFDSTGWKELPNPKIEVSSVLNAGMCPTCLGLGRVGSDVRRCSLCLGEADEWCDAATGTLKDGCQKCFDGWVGGTECRHCRGERWLDEANIERLCGVAFSAAEVGRLRTLGGLDFRVLPDVESRFHIDCTLSGILLVRGDDGLRGMLCGLSETKASR